MVLQRNTTVHIYGFADFGIVVSAFFQGKYYTSEPANHHWTVFLPPQNATVSPQTILFNSSDQETQSLQNILFGDVHLCSGQSNMLWSINASVPITPIDRYDFSLIRLFSIGQGTESATPLLQLNTVQQTWFPSMNSPNWTLFSAVCWFTYQAIFIKLEGIVPMGLISSNWPGTSIDTWSSPAALAICSNNIDSLRYNAMIHPYTIGGGMKMRTAIWYQGESDIFDKTPPASYECKINALIHDWRQKIPGLNTFGIIQIAPCTSYLPKDTLVGDFRQSQFSPLALLPNIATVVTLDLVYPWSEPFDIHPKNKHDIGSRMALQILALEYDFKDLEWQYPSYSSAIFTDTGLIIYLNNCYNSCYIQPLPLPPTVFPTPTFMIQMNDDLWYPSVSTILDGNSLFLSIPLGLTPIATSYSRASYPLATVWNKNHLPLAPWCFTLDGIPCYRLEESLLGLVFFLLLLFLIFITILAIIFYRKIPGGNG